MGVGAAYEYDNVPLIKSGMVVIGVVDDVDVPASVTLSLSFWL